MAWDHIQSAGSTPVLQSTRGVPAPTNLATHVSSATVVGNSVSGQVTLNSDGTGGSTGVQCRIPFTDLVAGATYSVTATADSQASNDATGTGLTAGVFTNAGVASLYIALSTGMAASKKQVFSYHIERVG